MQAKWLNWIGAVPVLAGLLLLATGAGRGRAGAPPGKTDAPKLLPEKIVVAWKEAGAELGWMCVGEYSDPGFSSEKAGKPGEVPAFRFAVWPARRLVKLPAPAAFGLCLAGTQLTDAELKEVATLKNLRALNLFQTGVTAAGLKELAGLKTLQSLDLYETKVTDAGAQKLHKALPGCKIRR